MKSNIKRKGMFLDLEVKLSGNKLVATSTFERLDRMYQTLIIDYNTHCKIVTEGKRVFVRQELRSGKISFCYQVRKKI